MKGGVAFSNVATELVAGDSAVVSHYMIEREHTDAFNISTLRIQQERSANVATHSILLGGGLVRNNVHPVLTGRRRRVPDQRSVHRQRHASISTTTCWSSTRSRTASSRQFYNGILDGKSHGVFHGRIIVHKDAQKTDAKQTNRNLLLSDDAQIDTKPQLEIYADDVKCTHGATIGQIEENALFYLRSRGIDERSARKLLLLAFASECLDRMKEDAVRTHIEGLIHNSLFAMAHARQAAAGSDRRGQGEILGGSRMTTAANSVSWEQRPPLQPALRYTTLSRFARDFPILHAEGARHPLVYLDNAATSQKPRAVIDAISRYYESGQRQHSSWRALLCRARDRRARSGARARCSISSTPPTSARSSSCAAPPRPSTWWRRRYGRKHVKAGDEVLITAMEHHSNIVPWQMLCEEKGATLRVAAHQRSRRARAWTSCRSC